MNDDLFTTIKKEWSNQTTFYDGLNYANINLRDYNISLISSSDSIEILPEPFDQELYNRCSADEVLAHLKKIDSILEKREETTCNAEYEGFDDEAEEAEYIGVPDAKNNKNRKITIISWGKKHHKLPPAESQFNINAGLLSGKKQGLNLKELDGRSSAIQARIIRARLFHDMTMKSIEKIENNNLSIISVNCTAGRHRSVAFSEILKKYYYPHAEIIHLDL